MKNLYSIRNKYAVLETNGILFAMCFTISLYGKPILTYLKETMKISLKDSVYLIIEYILMVKFSDKNKLFNPCDPFFMLMFVAKKEEEVTDCFFLLAITPTSIQQQSNAA